VTQVFSPEVARESDDVPQSTRALWHRPRETRPLDTAAVTALLDRLLHHGRVLKCGPRSWRTKVQTDLRTDEGTK
jgi:hypothetical protein